MSLQSLRLSISIAKAEFKLRYEGSYLGILWYLLNPLLLFLLLFTVFSDRVGQNILHYPLYLLLGIIMFNLFQKITTDSTKIAKGKRYLIKSIDFPREALVGASAIKFLYSHSFEIVVFTVFMLVIGVPLEGILSYPLILLLFSIFIYGISLGLFSISFYFLDLEDIWFFVSRLLWFATPIFYAIGGQRRLFIINLFNPIYYFITAARDTLIYSKIPELWILVGMIFYSLLSLLTGKFIFNRLKGKFAEKI